MGDPDSIILFNAEKSIKKVDQHTLHIMLLGMFS